MISKIIKLNFFKIKFLNERVKTRKLKKKIKNYKIFNEFEEIIKNKKFSTKWFLNNYKIFGFFFPSDFNKKFNYLEIGSFEGMSALFIVSFWKNSNVTCIDTWKVNNDKSQILNYDFTNIEQTFKKNLENYDINIVKNDSRNALQNLKKKGLYYDYIYIDGSHNGLDIFSDAKLSFELLNQNGIIIFDDIQNIYNEINFQPHQAFEKFYNLYKNKIKILYLKNIAIIKKINF